jgi:hypothetical protein
MVATASITIIPNIPLLVAAKLQQVCLVPSIVKSFPLDANTYLVLGKPKHDQQMDDKSHPNSSDARTWTWFPTWYELRTHYFREVGFLACLAQMIGATIFWIAGLTSLPGIYNKLSTPAINGAYWAPQVIGGSGFVVSSLFFMLETQQKWYLPAPKTLGYWIGLWNLIGAIGFTLCGCLGYSSNENVLYESSLATFWGSWAFLIGSLIQWFEALDKHPVDIEEGAGRISTNKNDPSIDHT